MTREEAIKKLRIFQTYEDPESAHSLADEVLTDLLTALGYKDVVDEWDKIERWYA